MAKTPSSEGANPIAAPRRYLAPGEVFCPSCGSVTRAIIELCGGCGVRISNQLKGLAAEAKAELWPNHDMAFWRTLKRFPEYHA